MTDDSPLKTSGISAEVFERFLVALDQKGVSEEIRANLRKTLLVDSKFTDAALRAAVLGEDSPP